MILADEPTGALDSKSGADVMRLLEQLSDAGHTVILITHAAEVAAHARRIIEIRDGLVVADTVSSPPVRQPSPESLPLQRSANRLADLYESAKSAVRALRANVFRSVLTLLGIVIGVASVIAMLAIGDGAKQEVLDRISAMGSNLLLVRPGAPNQRGFRNTATLVLADVRAIDTEVPNILAAVPEQESNATCATRGRTIRRTSWAPPQSFLWRASGESLKEPSFPMRTRRDTRRSPYSDRPLRAACFPTDARRSGSTCLSIT